jgi:ferric-chelate reductase
MIAMEDGKQASMSSFASSLRDVSLSNAPSSVSCVTSRSIVLGARVAGDWTQALKRYASIEQRRLAATENNEKAAPVQMPVHVMIDGPYGGCGLYFGEYETVLLIAGGAGVTFTVGLLDDLVGRVVRHQRGRGERTRRVEFVWAIQVRSLGEQVLYFYFSRNT